MKKKKNRDAALKPLKQPLPAWAYVRISLAGLLIGIGLLFLYIFKAPDLVNQGIEKSVFYVLLLPLGLAAAAFLFGAMHAYARYTGKVLSGRLEIMGPAVVFFLVIILGFVLIPGVQAFDFTLFLQDAEGKTVLKSQGMVRIIFDNNAVTHRVDEYGAVNFKGIHPKFMNQEVPVELEAEGWRFINHKVSTTCRLKGNNAGLTIERYGLDSLSGTIMDEEGHFIPGAKVAVKDLVAFSDENGWFSLEIPPGKQEEKQMVAVQKEGYQPYRDYAYPGNPTKLVIVLKREKER
jgi:hypothetical protein